MTTVELVLSGLVALLGGGGLWSFMSERGKTKVDLIELGQSIAASTIAAMQVDREALLSRIGGLEDQITALKEQLAELLAHAEALEGVLKAQGITPPARPKKRI